MTGQPVQPSQKETEQLVKSVYQYAAQLMKAGQSSSSIVDALTKKGLEPAVAQKVVDNLQQARTKAVRNNAGRDMLVGAAICVVGIVVTVATYAAASSSRTGGSYFVAWGAIIFGAIQFFRGLVAARG
jgi:hypothetical protein